MAKNIAFALLFASLILPLSATKAKKTVATAPTEPPIQYFHSFRAHPNVWIVTSKADVPSGDYVTDPHSSIPACSDGSDSQLEDHVKTFVSAYLQKDPRLRWTAAFAGPVTKEVVKTFEKLTGPIGGSVGSFLNQMGAPKYAACASLAVVVPVGSEIRQIRLAAMDGWNKSWDADCTAGPRPAYVCQTIGYSAWHRAVSGNVVSGVFLNWSHDRWRRAQLEVDFIPPRRWQKIHPLSAGISYE